MTYEGPRMGQAFWNPNTSHTDLWFPMPNHNGRIGASGDQMLSTWTHVDGIHNGLVAFQLFPQSGCACVYPHLTWLQRCCTIHG